MKERYWLLAYLAVGITLALTPGVHAVTVSLSEGNGDQSFSSTVFLQAEDSELASCNAILGRDGLSQIVSGSGNMNESHVVNSNQGSHAEVSAKIINADRYDYRYILTPDNLDHVKAI
jgi:hypothetical protein